MNSAQQQIIDELREEISILREQIESRDRHMNVCRGRTKCPADEVLAEWLKGFTRLDDPVVTGLVEALNRLVVIYESEYDEPPMRPGWLRNPLSAYEARVKEVSGE